MENDVKELYFGLYCKTCKYYWMPADKRPCLGCIREPLGEISHKPIKWEPGK